MKKIFMLLAISIVAFGTQAQEKKAEEKKRVEIEIPEIPEVGEIEGNVELKIDTVKTKKGNKVVFISEDDDEVTLFESKSGKTRVSFYGENRNRVWAGFEFGFTGLSYDKNFDTDVPDNLKHFEVQVEKSINWSLNLVEFDVRLIDEYVKFSTGMGYQARNFSFSNNYRLGKDLNDSIVGIEETNYDLKKNRFRVGYLRVPVLLQFNTNKNPKKSFRLSAGVVGGLKLFQTYRTKYFQRGHKVKTAVNGGWNANAFTAEMRGTIGYGPINIYATYSLTPLFKDGKGPELYPYTIGLNFAHIF